MPITNPITFNEIIRRQLNVRPLLGIEDAYKLIYQGVFGGEHLLTNSTHASQFLDQEFDAIIPAEHEPMIEIISPSGAIVRLNLRPYKSRRGEPAALYRAMQQSAALSTGTLPEFLESWTAFKDAVWRHELPFDEQQLLQFDRHVESQNYPAQHHSAAYRRAYQPAYRVLKRYIAEILIRQLPL
ncbi:MAG: hypothetical protein ONB11_03610 [candidate division KSB1 bacterium]|nr:hypothetical protein [candidate division KSB1 bacterium]MDZ7342480.1 hypothetical protein [candidate division KSB1 bacterium]